MYKTLKKLDAVNGTVAMTLDKLPNIRGDLVRNDPSWEQWDYLQLTTALQHWTRRNPVGPQTLMGKRNKSDTPEATSDK